jgi:hypothetical protein
MSSGELLVSVVPANFAEPPSKLTRGAVLVGGLVAVEKGASPGVLYSVPP